MNTRINITAFALILAAFTGVHAQTELPNDWVDQQVKAAAQQAATQTATAAAPASAETTASSRAPVLAALANADSERAAAKK